MSLAACLVLSLTVGAAPAAAPKKGDLVDGEGKPIAWRTLLHRARDASIILIGESHTSTCDHRMQRRIIDALAAEGLAPAIGMEMVAVDQALVLKKFNEGRIAPSEMGRALSWKETWGFPFPLYQPLFEAARRHKLPMVALNVPQMAAFLVAHRHVNPEDLHPKAMAVVPTIPPSRCRWTSCARSTRRTAASWATRWTSSTSPWCSRCGTARWRSRRCARRARSAGRW
jgi:hypothetical protein